MDEKLRISEERRAKLEKEVEMGLFEIYELKEKLAKAEGTKKGGEGEEGEDEADNDDDVSCYSRVKIEKLNESLTALVAELEEAMKKNEVLSEKVKEGERVTSALKSRITTLQGEVESGASARSRLEEDLERIQVASDHQQSSLSPDKKLVEQLREQLSDQEATFKETMASLIKKNDREKAVLHARLATLEKAAEQPMQPRRSVPLSATVTPAHEVLSPSRVPPAPRRGVSADGRPRTPSTRRRSQHRAESPARHAAASSHRARTPGTGTRSGCPSAHDGESLERIKAHVDKTMARVSTVLKQLAETEGGKKGGLGSSRREPFRKSLSNAQHELAAARGMIGDYERGSPVRPPGPGRGFEESTVSSRHRNPSPRPHAKPAGSKSPIPPLSLSELRMRSPRLNLSPKNPFLGHTQQSLPSSRSGGGSGGGAVHHPPSGVQFTSHHSTASSARNSDRPRSSYRDPVPAGGSRRHAADASPRKLSKRSTVDF